jgi:aminoglycoside phosphotransferase (APT) family kinase protein
VTWPEADIHLDEDQVRSLLLEQHPDLAGMALVECGSGWDNTLWRLGDDLLVRLPRRMEAVALTTNEQEWLPKLAPRLTLPIPTPVRVGRPTIDFPWPWSIVPWLDGLAGDCTEITRPDAAALSLGRFLRALHEPAPIKAPVNPYRGVPLSARATDFADRIAALDGEIDVPATRQVWDRAIAAHPWQGPPLWLHGDLHPANILIVGGTLSAVIDFGDLCAGDPATDLAAAWMLLPVAAIPKFSSAYSGLDADLECRALGWAVLFALMLFAIGLNDRPSYLAVGQSTLAKVIEDSDRRT